jgi:multidrug efflux pump subunit AcrB
VVFLTGIVQSLFTPLAMTVVVAMIASYLLSRMLLPTLVRYLLHSEVEMYQHVNGDHGAAAHGLIWNLHQQFNRRFERFRGHYHNGLATLHQRAAVIGLAGTFFVGSLMLVLFIGQDFFPLVNAGQLRLHARAPAGTRIEETKRVFSQVEDVIRRTIPTDQLSLVLDNMGLPVGCVNRAFTDSSTIGPSEGEILVALNPEHHSSTWEYVKELRQRLNAQFPHLTSFFNPLTASAKF